MVSSDFFVFFVPSYDRQFSKNSVFQKRVHVFKFLCCKSIFLKTLFLRLQKHYKNGFQQFFVFLLLQEKKKARK